MPILGCFGLAAPGKGHEPLPKVAASAHWSLDHSGTAPIWGPRLIAAMASERWEEAAQETLAPLEPHSKRSDLAAVICFASKKAKLKMLVIFSCDPRGCACGALAFERKTIRD